MRLYHGTNQDITTIDLTKGLAYKDFGQGFYLTPDLATAERMARKRARLFGGEAVLIEYEFDESVLSSDVLNVLQYPEKANVEWARFVDRNRDRRKEPLIHEYDIISGPIADDGVAYLLGRFHEGTMTLEELAEGLQDKHLDQQYYFGTERALQSLTKVNVTRL